MNKVDKIDIVGRAVLTIVLSIPLETVFLVLAVGLIGNIYFYFTDLFSHSVVAGISIQFFFESWFFGFGIYILHVTLYIFFILLIKVKIRYDLLGALIIAIIVSRILWITPSSGGGFLDFSSWWREISNAFLFAMIMFAVFTISTVVLDRLKNQAKEWQKILWSVGISFVLGTLLSLLIWLILFRAYG